MLVEQIKNNRGIDFVVRANSRYYYMLVDLEQKDDKVDGIYKCGSRSLRTYPPLQTIRRNPNLIFSQK